MRILATCFAIWVLVAPAFGRDVFVDGTSGNDADSGLSFPLAKATINGAHAIAQPGDVIYVIGTNGTTTYNVQQTWTADGAAGNIITVKGVGMPIVRGFALSGANYVRFQGFEITHVNQSFARAFPMTGVNGNIEILDNYIHNINGQGGCIRAISGNSVTNLTARGNIISNINFIAGVVEDGEGQAFSFEPPSSHLLIEYNVCEKMGDFTTMDGAYFIIRNNRFGDFRNSYFPTGPPDNHVDTYQPFRITNHVCEANMGYDNIELNSHWMQIRTLQYGQGLIMRGNAVFNYGSYTMQAGSIQNIHVYQNTFVNMGHTSSDGSLGYDAQGVGGATANATNINNIFQNLAGSAPITTGGGATVNASHNLGFNAGSHASLISTANPLLMATNLYDFRLGGGSPAINAGKSITRVSSTSGTGTSFDVPNGTLFCDGFGLTQGDTITVDTDVVTITGISGNTITYTPSITFAQGDHIYWQTDTTPDLGALPSGSVTNIITSIDEAGNVTVSASSEVRFVEFRDANDLLVSIDYTAPFSGPAGSRAIARPLRVSRVLAFASSGSEVPPTVSTIPGNAFNRASGAGF